MAIPLIQAGSVTRPERGRAERATRPTPSTSCAATAAPAARSPITNAAGGSAAFDKPVDNIGTKTIRRLRRLRRPSTSTPSTSRAAATPGKVFVGQRKDPFAVNLGTIFDLVNAPSAAVITDPALINARRRNDLAEQERHHARARGADKTA